MLPRIAVCAMFTVVLTLAAPATAEETIRVWKVGSPHTGDTPSTRVPLALRRAAAANSVRIDVAAFPARGFAATFADALARNAGPDVLVIDNMGVMDGITTALGHFEGIAQDPAVRNDFVRVTGAFDGLLGPQRGWTYLFASSPNHRSARTLALSAPTCAGGASGAVAPGDLAELVPKLATAYLEGDEATIGSSSDPDRRATQPVSAPIVRVGAVRLCGLWGNDKLVFTLVNASYDGETTIGNRLVLLVLRKASFEWRLLVAARDPISTDAFVTHASSMAALLARKGQMRALPASATLVSPADGRMPRPLSTDRFGAFRWRSSLSDGVVAEIVEFAYADDARLFVMRPNQPGARGEISAGKLWTTRSTWQWRVWSITRDGDVVFSEARSFLH